MSIAQHSNSNPFWDFCKDIMRLNMSLIPDIKKVQRYMELTMRFNYPQPTWATTNNVIYEHQTLKLRHFVGKKPVSARRPILILPPQAGHHSNLADYSPAQSLVRVFQSFDYDVYVTEWLSATFEYKDLGINDYIRLTNEAVDEIRKRTGVHKIHIAGLCQGGWQASIYTSLYQEKIATLITSAAPIDVEAAPSAIIDYAQLPLAFFELLVAMGNGLMDGKFMLMGFKNMQAEEHYVRKYNRIWKMIDSGDEEGIKRFVYFENWYEYTQKLPGKFYLQVIKNIFQENNLTKPNSIIIDGRRVDLSNITCPAIIMAGKKDHITPPPQAFALKKHISTDPDDIVEILTDGGHIGTLMGTESLRESWTQVAEMLNLAV
ncbi:MAG: alpha/beta fold hydrolase [Syntrophomonadaceae bacterium]